MCELMHCWQKTGCVKPAHKQHQATTNDYSSYCIHHYLFLCIYTHSINVAFFLPQHKSSCIHLPLDQLHLRSQHPSTSAHCPSLHSSQQLGEHAPLIRIHINRQSMMHLTQYLWCKIKDLRQANQTFSAAAAAAFLNCSALIAGAFPKVK